MSVGYGRGYYGEGQLAPRAPRPRTSGWVKVAVVVGVGAVLWFMWPRSRSYEPVYGRGDDEPKPPPPLPPSQLPAAPPPSVLPAPRDQLQLPPTPNAFEGLPPLPPPQLTQEAISRGYPSQQAYEDAVVETARQLQDTGARVTLAPHLQHLALRVGP